MARPPAFQFYPADFKLDTDEMTAEQVAGWNRCVDSIPAALALWLEDENRL